MDELKFYVGRYYVTRNWLENKCIVYVDADHIIARNQDGTTTHYDGNGRLNINTCDESPYDLVDYTCKSGQVWEQACSGMSANLRFYDGDNWRINDDVAGGLAEKFLIENFCLLKQNNTKPCPFCGGEVKVFNRCGILYVGCDNEECDIKPETEYYNYESCGDYNYVLSLAVSAWNKRGGDK